MGLTATRSLRMTMTEPQARFFQLQDKYPAFVGGFGTGKTETLVNCAIRDASHSSAALVALYEPTFDLVKLILVPRLESKLIDLGIRYRYNKQDSAIYTSNGGMGDFVMRTLENPARIVGYESYRAHIDEIDTLKEKIALEVWQKVIARNRQRPAGIEDPFNRVSVYTTPEGYRFVYSTWGRNPKPGYAMVQAPTYSNPFLPDDYVKSLRDSYPAGLIDAYIEGKFTNLSSGSVYPDFSRTLNHADVEMREREPLKVGMDFNRLHMAAVVYVIRDGRPIAVDEITDGRDTPYMAQLLVERYKEKGHAVEVFPDASGNNKSSKNASESDLTILKAAGLTVRVNGTNPAIMDRVNAVNALICNGEQERRLLVNTNRCPVLTDALEQQAYDRNGMPDKSSGNDHVCFSADTIVETDLGLYRFDAIPESGMVRDGFGGWVRYRMAGQINESVTVRVVIDGLDDVECTPDHKFLTVEGDWVCAKDLKGRQLFISPRPAKSSMELGTTFVASISRTVRALKGCIAPYGSITMALSLMASTFITWMKTGRTTR